MIAQTMEGLIGAKANIDIVNVPMRVYKEAQRKGDTATMERALGYAGDFAAKAEAYQKKADEGMKKDAEEAKERAEQIREDAALKRKEERKKLEGRTEDVGEAQNSDTVGKESTIYTKSGGADAETLALKNPKGAQIDFSV